MQTRISNRRPTLDGLVRQILLQSGYNLCGYTTCCIEGLGGTLRALSNSLRSGVVGVGVLLAMKILQNRCTNIQPSVILLPPIVEDVSQRHSCERFA